MARDTEYHNCPLCGVQAYNVPAVNHVLHLLISVLTCGLWVFVWLFLSATRGNATCSSCGMTGRHAQRLAKNEDKEADKERRKIAEREAREAYNRNGPQVGSRAKVTQGDFKGRWGTVVANDGGSVTIADRKGRTKALPLSDFAI